MKSHKKTAIIWVLDDDESTLNLIRELLVMEGYQTEVFSDPIRFRHKAAKKQPDLFLIDMIMPLVSGATIATELKANPTTRTIPLILISADSRIIDQKRELLVDDILTKPFDINDLVTKVKKQLKK